MKVTELRVHTCFAMWRNWVFLEVVTDGGLIGVGEATLEGRELTVAGHLDDLRRVVVGRDPMDLRAIVRDLTRDPFWVGGYVAQSGLAAVEIALWDLIGRRSRSRSGSCSAAASATGCGSTPTAGTSASMPRRSGAIVPVKSSSSATTR